MIALKTERRVFLWHLTPRPNPAEAQKPVVLKDILTILEAEFEAERARAYLSDGGRLIEDDDENRDEKNQI